MGYVSAVSGTPRGMLLLRRCARDVCEARGSRKVEELDSISGAVDVRRVLSPPLLPTGPA